MKHYTLFALRIFGIALCTVLTLVIGGTGVYIAGTWTHIEYGTAKQVSGGATKIVTLHDTLLTRINKSIDGDQFQYNAGLAYGQNRYSFFDQNEACKIGQGQVWSFAGLQSKKYAGNVLRDRIKDVLDSNGYNYKVKIIPGVSKTRTEFTVTDGVNKSVVSVSDEKSMDIFGAYASVITTRIDETAPCYPINTLPRPHIDNKYL